MKKGTRQQPWGRPSCKNLLALLSYSQQAWVCLSWARWLKIVDSEGQRDNSPWRSDLHVPQMVHCLEFTRVTYRLKTGGSFNYFRLLAGILPLENKLKPCYCVVTCDLQLVRILRFYKLAYLHPNMKVNKWERLYFLWTGQCMNAFIFMNLSYWLQMCHCLQKYYVSTSEYNVYVVK